MDKLEGDVTVVGYNSWTAVVNVKTTAEEGVELLRALNEVKAAHEENHDLRNLEALKAERDALQARIDRAEQALEDLTVPYITLTLHGVTNAAVAKCPFFYLADSEGTVWADNSGTLVAL